MAKIETLKIKIDGKAIARTAHKIIAEQVEGVTQLFIAVEAARNDPAYSVMSPTTRALIEGALRVVNGAPPTLAKRKRGNMRVVQL